MIAVCRLVAILQAILVANAVFTPRQEAGSCSNSKVVSNATLVAGENSLELQIISCRGPSSLSKRSPQVERSAPVPLWGQCGGIGFTGSTVCEAGAACSVLNPYYSQCLPSQDGTVTSTTTVFETVLVEETKVTLAPARFTTVANGTVTVSRTSESSVTVTPQSVLGHPGVIVETSTKVVTATILVPKPVTTIQSAITLTSTAVVPTTVVSLSVLPTTVTAISLHNATVTALSIKPVTVTVASAESSFVTVVSLKPTTVSALTTVVITPTPAPPTASASTNACDATCTNSCGSIGDLPPISEDCATMFNSISLLDGLLPPTFSVLSGHIYQLNFGTCRIFFENFSSNTVTYCWSSLAQQASVAAQDCFPPVQPVNSLGLCTAPDGSWEIGIAHS